MLHGEAFDQSTFLAFLRGLHNKCKKEEMAILVDNSSIHDRESQGFIRYCDKMNISILQNVRYRPDFNGIESVWAWTKKRFRNQVDFFKANGTNKWDEMTIVAEIMDSIPEDVAMNATRVGFENIVKGKLVMGKRFKQGPHHNFDFVKDLAGVAKSNPSAQKQWVKFQAQMAEVNAQEEGEDQDED